MLSMIEVTCPHCAAQGQIMLPPLGAIIIGPCPECQGIVAVFCGRVLALDKQIMLEGSSADKRSHVNAVLGRFVRDRVERLFTDAEPLDDGPSINPLDISSAAIYEFNEAETESTDGADAATAGETAITTEELESFRNIDLRLLDNRDYFKAIFDES